ncbi:hypothetical protein C8J57DRAFT_1260266 [Mycena rebaudengoi]|nr:hypothetical protein C8J57DRAFT_1260266 [Mycena rebaudengoi]
MLLNLLGTVNSPPKHTSNFGRGVVFLDFHVEQQHTCRTRVFEELHKMIWSICFGIYHRHDATPLLADVRGGVIPPPASGVHAHSNAMRRARRTAGPASWPRAGANIRGVPHRVPSRTTRTQPRVAGARDSGAMIYCSRQRSPNQLMSQAIEKSYSRVGGSWTICRGVVRAVVMRVRGRGAVRDHATMRERAYSAPRREEQRSAARREERRSVHYVPAVGHGVAQPAGGAARRGRTEACRCPVSEHKLRENSHLPQLGWEEEAEIAFLGGRSGDRRTQNAVTRPEGRSRRDLKGGDPPAKRGPARSQAEFENPETCGCAAGDQRYILTAGINDGRT